MSGTTDEFGWVSGSMDGWIWVGEWMDRFGWVSGSMDGFGWVYLS